MLGSFGDISTLPSSQDWQSGIILLYLMDATNSTVGNIPNAVLLSQNFFLKAINIVFPEVEMDFNTLWLGVPNSSPISSDWSLGPS